MDLPNDLGAQIAAWIMRWAPTLGQLGEAASAIIAVIALIFAILSFRASARAVGIARDQETRQAPKIEAYVSESATWSLPGPKGTVVAVRVLVINQSDGPSAITRSDLAIAYTTEATQLNVIVHAEKVERKLAKPRLTVPSTLAGNDAVEGWLTFSLEDGLFSSSTIDSYTLEIEDSRGIIKRLDSLAIRPLGTP